MADENVNMETGEVESSSSALRFEPRKKVTFDPSLPENRVRMFNARNNATSLKSIGDKAINIVDVMTTIGIRTRSGSACQNTYLFTDDGVVYFTQSNGIGKTVNELVDMIDGDFSHNTTSGYVKVQMKEISLSGNRTYKQFALLEV